MSLEQNTTFLGYFEMLSPHAAHFHLLLSTTAHHTVSQRSITKVKMLSVIYLHLHDAIIFNKHFHNKHPFFSIAGCHLCN